jgi:hypothetical protein
MSTRKFDLLTHPIAPGETFMAMANLSFQNARNFLLDVPYDVQDAFEIESSGFEETADDHTSGRYVVKGKRRDDASGTLRFACDVLCDTDDPAEAA